VTTYAWRYPYPAINSALGPAGSLPYIPVRLELQDKAASVFALVDSGSALNVLPYDVGLQLGAIWAQQSISIPLTGTLADIEARAILLSATVGPFAPVKLAFAWSHSNRVPVILGQVSFFSEFDVCFHRSQSFFEIMPKGSGGAGNP
jgi:hypothetical protein